MGVVSDPDGNWTLEQLSDLAEQEVRERHIANPGGRVSPVPSSRTIRYYTSLGLVDKPSYVGGTARYGPRHLNQLLAIKALQADYLPLPAIQKRLTGKSDEEIREIVEAATRTLPLEPEKPTVESWGTCQALPGLRLLVEDRDALLEFMLTHGAQDVQDRLVRALNALTAPRT
ncbi:MAG: MerR family transcriptional regulator [Candidatus Eremiobacterota bacterium]